MDESAFQRMKSDMQRDFPPSNGDDLLGMEIDFVAYLGGVTELEKSQCDDRPTPTG